MVDSKDKHTPNPPTGPGPGPIDVFEAFYSSIHKYVDARIEHAKRIEESSLLNRIVDKINSAINRMPVKIDSQSQLTGRIIELNQNASEVLVSLTEIKKDLKVDVDEDLFPFIDAVMEPMIRDVMRIQNTLHDDKAIYKQAEAFKRYSEWVDRAKLWVSLCSTKKDKDTIVAAIIKHTLDDFSSIIERDKRLIEDYLDHVLAYTSFDEDRKEIVAEEIRNALKPYLKCLISLKTTPVNLSLDTLNVWKEHADNRRDRCYNAALQVVDNLVTKVKPSVTQDYEQASLIGLLEQLDFLEEEIGLLCERIANKQKGFEIESQLLEAELLSFEQEVHELYFDVRMPPDAIKRLKALKRLLGKSFKQLKK